MFTEIALPESASRFATFIENFLSGEQKPTKKSFQNLKKETSHCYLVASKENNETELLSEVKKLKLNVDEVFVESVILELIREIKNRVTFNKLGIDYKPGYLYFWFEMNCQETNSELEIERIFEKTKLDIFGSGLFIENIVVDEFLNLDIPDGYKQILVKRVS